MKNYLLAGLAVSAIAWGTEAPRPASDDQLRLRGIFESLLPNTEGKYTLKLTLRPHLGDLVRRDHLRLPVGVRYGLSERWEASAEVESYFAHGLGDVAGFDRIGLSEVRLASKYHWRTFPWPGWDAAVGFEYIRPVSRPPAELTDGLEHFVPYITFARRLESNPAVRIFWGLSTDYVGHTSIPATRGVNELGDDAQKVSGGFIWERGQVAYTFETEFSTTRFSGYPDRDLLVLRPGLLWHVPPKFTARIGGQWQLGLGLRTEFGPDETDFGVQAKVRVDFDFKQWWREMMLR